jgi:hypothetical protein
MGLTVVVVLLYPPGPAKFGVLAGADFFAACIPGKFITLVALNPVGLPAVVVAVGAGAALSDAAVLDATGAWALRSA